MSSRSLLYAPLLLAFLSILPTMTLYLPKTIWHCTDKKVNDPIFSIDGLNDDEQPVFATGAGDNKIRVCF